MSDHEADIRTVRDFVSLRYQDRPTREALAALDRIEAELEGHRANADTLAAMTATLTEYGYKMHDLLDERDRLLENQEIILTDQEVRDRLMADPQLRERAAMTATLRRVEAERDHLHTLYNKAQDDASKAAEDMVRYRIERDRLREALQDILGKGRFEYPAHDDMCGESGSGQIGECDKDYCPVAIARAALSPENQEAGDGS